jgi:NADH-quinone oxidoreductase subunit B
MDYTLTRIDPNGENDRYPLQKQEIVADPLEQQVHRTVYMGKLEHALHDMVNWGRKTLFGRITSAFRAVTWRW